jgi:hypothetical protein
MDCSQPIGAQIASKANAPKTNEPENNASEMKTRQSKLIRVKEFYNPRSRAQRRSFFQVADSSGKIKVPTITAQKFHQSLRKSSINHSPA